MILKLVKSKPKRIFLSGYEQLPLSQPFVVDDDEEIYSGEFVEEDLTDVTYQPSEEMSGQSSDAQEAPSSDSFSNMEVSVGVVDPRS